MDISGNSLKDELISYDIFFSLFIQLSNGQELDVHLYNSDNELPS